MTQKRIIELITAMEEQGQNIYEFAILLIEEQKEQAAKIAETAGQPAIALTIRNT